MKSYSSTFLFSASIFLLFSCRSIADSGSTRSNKIHSKSAESALQVATPAEKRGFYNWLIKEMYEQILLRSPSPKNDIAGWANVFAQGGSIEGVYHGLVLSTDYSALEIGKANIKSARFFAEEMAELELVALDNKKPDEAKLKARSEKLMSEGLKASVFTMKRTLGEKLLSEIEKRKSDRNNLADWYAEKVVRWAKLDVSFGTAQRGNQDIEFHKNWAKENSLGLVQWEILNRAHRILNSYNGLLISPADK